MGRYEFGVTGQERKNLVAAVCEILNAPKKYSPGQNLFEIGEYIVDKNGTLHGEENMELLEGLTARGFSLTDAPEETADEGEIAAEEAHAETGEAEAPAFETAATEAETGSDEAASESTAEQDGDSFTIEMPLMPPDKLDNLCRMVESKETLLKAALDTEALPIQQGQDTLRFPWWNRVLTGEEVEAYTTLISLMCQTAKEKSRIIAKDGGMPINPKYAFRCYLLSLDMIGPEYQKIRRTLLSRLSGNSSWKNGKPSTAADDEPSAPVEIKSERELILGQLPEGTKILRMYNAAEDGELRVITDEGGEKRYAVAYEDGIPVITHKP